MFSCSETCLTLLLLGTGILLMAWAAYRERRWLKGEGAPLLPTTPVMFAGAVLALLALVHLLTLSGSGASALR